MGFLLLEFPLLGFSLVEFLLVGFLLAGFLLVGFLWLNVLIKVALCLICRDYGFVPLNCAAIWIIRGFISRSELSLSDSFRFGRDF